VLESDGADSETESPCPWAAEVAVATGTDAALEMSAGDDAAGAADTGAAPLGPLGLVAHKYMWMSAPGWHASELISSLKRL